MGKLIPEMSQAEMQAFEDKAFASWMIKVDYALTCNTGLVSKDITPPVAIYRSMFDEGEAPNLVPNRLQKLGLI